MNNENIIICSQLDCDNEAKTFYNLKSYNFLYCECKECEEHFGNNLSDRYEIITKEKFITLKKIEILR